MPIQPQFSAQSPLETLGFYWLSYGQRLIDGILHLTIAVVVVIIGFAVAKAIEFVVRFVVERLKINEFLSSAGFGKFLEKANVALKTEEFLGALVFWVVWVLFWMSAFDTLGWFRINQFIEQIIAYLPTALIAGLIVVGSLFLGDFLRRVSYVWFKGLELKGARQASEVVFYAVVIFGIANALYQLGITREIIGLIIGGIVLALSIAFGLAFGLGGQEIAKELLTKVKEKLLE